MSFNDARGGLRKTGRVTDTTEKIVTAPEPKPDRKFVSSPFAVKAAAEEPPIIIKKTGSSTSAAKKFGGGAGSSGSTNTGKVGGFFPKTDPPPPAGGLTSAKSAPVTVKKYGAAAAASSSTPAATPAASPARNWKTSGSSAAVTPPPAANKFGAGGGKAASSPFGASSSSTTTTSNTTASHWKNTNLTPAISAGTTVTPSPRLKATLTAARPKSTTPPRTRDFSAAARVRSVSPKRDDNLFCSRPPSNSILSAVSKDLLDYVKRLQTCEVLANIETTPRDNDLVTAMYNITSNKDSVGEMHVDNDPRFAHISQSIILDMGDGMRYNFYLTRLTMQHVELGNGFLSALAGALPYNYTLEYLNLRYNALTSEALAEFAIVGMKDNESLQHVDLRDQHSPIFTHQEQEVLDALEANTFVKTFEVEFMTESCQDALKKILNRNQSKGQTLQNREQKLLQFFKAETERAEKDFAEEQKAEATEASKELGEEDCDYFFELANIAKLHNVDLNKTDDTPAAGGGAAKNAFGFAGGPGSPSAKVGKALNLPATAMTADGAFLNTEFISPFIEQDATTKLWTFEFTNQFKLFKRFSISDPARALIVEKFVDALIQHPQSKEINILNLANTCIADDVLQLFCNRCMAEHKFPNLHHLNLETNFLTGPGLVALAACIRDPNTWRYLNAIKMENQKSPVKTEAEVALARAVRVNRTIIRFSLRVRNLRERERINKCVQRNIDYLRQARQLHLKKTGQTVKRARNSMEQMFDRIAANDPTTKGEVNLVGDQLFLALHESEVIKAAAAFRDNTHVTTVKMINLKLDEKFAIELAKSIEHNATIEKLILDNNAIGSEGITALIGSLAHNKTITELQLRHQSKPLCTADEEKLAGLLGENDTLIKFGVDLRSTRARNDVDRRIRENNEKRRKDRRALSQTPPRAGRD